MSRVKRGFKARRRRNRVLKLAKGFHFDRRTKFKHALDTVRRSLHNEYKGRRLLKRDMRSLWIQRINAAVRLLEGTYSQFMNKLKTKGIELNRKSLSELAYNDFSAFKELYLSL